MPASPAKQVNQQATSRYQSHFGKSYYLFEQQGCVFIILNSSLINSGEDDEQLQWQWLQKTLQQHQGKRLFLFSHYPPFLHDANEPEHYDNIAQPGRGELLALVEKYAVEAVFSGHVHHFFCNSVRPDDKHSSLLFCLPPTSFTRQDYAEIFHVQPAAEFGRDDRGKFSVGMIDVLATGFRLRIIPTDGAEPSSAGNLRQPVAATPEISAMNLSVPLRHAFHESIDLPFNGPMEEFSRKRCRNDYTLMRLLQMGITRVRVPLQDLLDDPARQRIQLYHRMGIHFDVFCLGLPDRHTAKQIMRHADMLRSLELICPTFDSSLLADFSDSAVADILTEHDRVDLTLSKAHSSAHKPVLGKTFAHSVSNGFLWEERETVFSWLEQYDTQNSFRSITFQIPLEVSGEESIAQMQTCLQQVAYAATANLKLANSNPAQSNFDNESIFKRVAGALDAVSRSDKVTLQLDTFMDVDRGYAPRYGLLDRRCNFRETGKWLQQAELNRLKPPA